MKKYEETSFGRVVAMENAEISTDYEDDRYVPLNLTFLCYILQFINDFIIYFAY